MITLEQLQQHAKWLFDGSGKRIEVICANLTGAKLSGAKLSDANLIQQIGNRPQLVVQEEAEREAHRDRGDEHRG